MMATVPMEKDMLPEIDTCNLLLLLLQCTVVCLTIPVTITYALHKGAFCHYDHTCTCACTCTSGLP